VSAATYALSLAGGGDTLDPEVGALVAALKTVLGVLDQACDNPAAVAKAAGALCAAWPIVKGGLALLNTIPGISMFVNTFTTVIFTNTIGAALDACCALGSGTPPVDGGGTIIGKVPPGVLGITPAKPGVTVAGGGPQRIRPDVALRFPKLV